MYRFISAEKARTPVSMCCGLLGVSRSGYCDWACRRPAAARSARPGCFERIKAIHTANRGVYGARRVHAELRMAEGVRVGRKRVERLMRGARLSGWSVASAARRRSASRASGSPMTSSSASSARPARTCSGSRTSPTCVAGRGGSTSPPSRTPTRVGSSAGRWPATCAPSSWSTRCRWRSPAAAPAPG